jgi:hypothetical protein
MHAALISTVRPLKLICPQLIASAAAYVHDEKQTSPTHPQLYTSKSYLLVIYKKSPTSICLIRRWRHLGVDLDKGSSLLLSNPLLDLIGVETGSKVGRVVKLDNLDLRVVAGEDDSSLEGTGSGSSEVISRSSTAILGTGSLPGVQVVGESVVTGVENLKEIELATSGGPARTRGLAVLQSSGNLGVEHPDGGHISVEALGVILGHGELEKEDFVGSTKAMVGRRALSDVATVVAAALLVGHDQELLVGGDGDIAKNLRRSGTGNSVSAAEGQGVSETRVPSTGTSGSSLVVQESETVRLARRRAVESRSLPVRVANGSLRRHVGGNGNGGRGDRLGLRRQRLPSLRGANIRGASGGGTGLGGIGESVGGLDGETVLVSVDNLGDLHNLGDNTSLMSVVGVELTLGGLAAVLVLLLDSITLGVTAVGVVDSKLLQRHGASEGDGELLVQRGQRARKGLDGGRTGTRAGVHAGDGVVGTSETNVLVGDFGHLVTVGVASNLLASGSIGKGEKCRDYGR